MTSNINVGGGGGDLLNKYMNIAKCQSSLVVLVSNYFLFFLCMFVDNCFVGLLFLRVFYFNLF